MSTDRANATRIENGSKKHLALEGKRYNNENNGCNPHLYPQNSTFGLESTQNTTSESANLTLRKLNKEGYKNVLLH